MENMVNMNKSFWKDKKVFITGNTGFKGSWLALWLDSMGSNLLGYSDKIYSDNIHDVNKTCETIIGDIRDFEKLKSSIHRFNPEIVIHLAAQPLVRESYSIPKETYEINLMGTLNVYESVLALKSKCIILSATTDKVYFNKEQLWGYRETDELGGQDPYSNSKSCVELMSYSYNNSFFKNSIHKLFTARAGNVIGGGDWSKDRLIPDIIKNYYSNTIIELRNPLATRPWQYVLEPLYGYLSLIEKYWNEETIRPNFNFGPNFEQCITVEEVTKILMEYFGKNINESVINGIDKTLHESKLLFLDCTKSKSEIRWKPTLTTKESLIKTAEWYKCFHENLDVIKTSLNQIEDFEKKANIH